MDLEDLFKRDNHHRKHSKHDKKYDRDLYPKHDEHMDYRDHPYNRDRHNGHRDLDDLLDVSSLLGHLQANRKLLIVAGVIILIIIVALFIFVLPLLGQAVEYVEKIGLKGVVDRLWQGTGGSK